MLEHPLVSFRSEPPARVRIEGQAFPHRVEVAGESHRAILSRSDSSIGFLLKELRGGEVTGSAAVLARPGAPTTTVGFRTLVRDGDDELLLFEERLAPGELRPFRSALPSGLGEGAELWLEVDHEDGLRGPASPAAWIEPVLRRATPRQRSAAPESPHILLITADTTRQDDLGLYGGPVRTPALAALAEHGFVLGNVHSVAYGTTPSHSSLMTSLPAIAHGVYDNHSLLAPGFLTLAEVLREAGYDTAAFVSARPLARALGLDQGFDLYDDAFVEDAGSGLGTYSRHERRADATVDQLLDWLERRGESPFFAWIHLFDAHQPYSPPPGWAEPYLPGPLASASADVRELLGPSGEPRYLKAKEVAAHDPGILPELERVARGLYRGEIAFLDAQLARIFAALAARGLDQDALVLFVADHGENFLERKPQLAFEHAGLHREVTRLPLVLRPPGARRPGARFDLLAASIDLAPTLLDYAGLEAPASWAGASLRPALEGSGAAPQGRDYVILEGAHRQEIAVRTPHWLYREVREPYRAREHILSYLGFAAATPVELYDLSTDPGEGRGLALEDQQPLARLQGMIRQHLASERAEAEVLASPEHREALEALGYVE